VREYRALEIVKAAPAVRGRAHVRMQGTGSTFLIRKPTAIARFAGALVLVDPARLLGEEGF
jgi:hypothetical protein